MISSKEDYCCVIKDKLYFRNKILGKDDKRLKELGIKAIVDVLKYAKPEDRYKHSDYFKFFHLEIIDNPLNNADWTEECAKFIDQQIKINNPVYVHCAQGISRSATLIIYYLMTREKKNFKDSFFYLKKLRNVVCPTTGFIKSLCLYDEQLFGKMSFNIDDYSLLCLKESFPSINEDQIKNIYENNKKFYNQNQDLYVKDAKEKKSEPIGYKTIDDLIQKYGKDKMILREGCALHHPFE